MAPRDGNGWVACRCGEPHWGLHGAAGLLLLRPDDVDGVEMLLQLRAGWTHFGGSWALPGGARDSHEDVVTAALREADEEAGVDTSQVRVIEVRPGVDHTDWRYTYVIATAPRWLVVRASAPESDELRWVPTEEVTRLPLHPAFAQAWPALAEAVRAVAPAGPA